MRRNKEPMPQVGQHRIVEVTHGDRSKHYVVETYDWGWEARYWQHVASCKTMAEAIKVIPAAQDKQVVNRRVVWL